MIAEIVENKIKNNQEIILELGCGPNKTKGTIGVDIVNADGVDIVANIEDGLPFIPNKSVDVVQSKHFLEHIENLEVLLVEIHRVLKPNGIHRVIVPHFSNPHFYSDYTHRAFFGLYSFDYFASEKTKLKRKVPSFYSDVKFNILKRRLVFKSRFTLIHFLRKPVMLLFNSSNSFQEIYEELFCYIFPCQEIVFEMTPVQD